MRTALCIYGFFGSTKGEIIFASPKIMPACFSLLETYIVSLNDFFKSKNFVFNFHLIYNEKFGTEVVDPVLAAVDTIEDTSELFVRSAKIISMFNFISSNIKPKKNSKSKQTTYSQYSIGQLAQVFIPYILQSNKVTAKEFLQLQDKDYSKKTFGIQYSLLVKEGESFDYRRYYKKSIEVKKINYYLCSQWYQTPSNNDRPLLENWIENHK